MQLSATYYTHNLPPPRAGDLALLIPPQISPEFIRRLGQRLCWPDVLIVDVSGRGGDLLTSSTPAAMKHIFDDRLANEGDLGLIVNVGSGLQMACGLYRF